MAKGYDHVVSVAAGCSATPGITDITVWLQGHEIPARSPALAPRRVAYDAPCHLLHAQGIDARALLENLPGIVLVPLTGADDCCGAGGIYMRVQPRLARDIRAKKLDAIEDAAVDVVATGNPGCLLWLWRGLKERGSRVRVAHPMSLLAELEA